MSDPTFVTVHDLGLSIEEARVWGGLPRTPEAYPSIDGMTAHDSALAHVVVVCMERQDDASARRYAALITDPKMRAVRLGLISSEGAKVANDDTVSLHELVLANNIELDALVKVLVDKGVITEGELFDAIQEMKRQIVGEGRPGNA